MNHAYILLNDLPDPKEVDRLLRSFIKRRMPAFSLEMEWVTEWVKNERIPHWLLKLKDSSPIGTVGITFWYDEFFIIDDSGETTAHPCIEFRHGHNYHFLWWIESEIFGYLYRLYEGKAYDDGIGYFEPNPSFPSYDAYLQWYASQPPADEEMAARNIVEHCRWFPDLVPWLRGFLYHGTMAEEFRTDEIRYPFYLTSSEEKAESFSIRNEANGPRRVMSFQLKGSPNLFEYTSESALEQAIGPVSEQEDGARYAEIARKLEAAGFDGFIEYDAYRIGGNNVCVFKPGMLNPLSIHYLDDDC